VPMKVVQEALPVMLKGVRLEVSQRKLDCVVDANKRGGVGPKFRNKPFCQAAARPVLSWAWWRTYLFWCVADSCDINPQPWQAAGRCLCAGVVNADVPSELPHF